MDISKVSWFTTASQKMDWIGQRQKVISENMANADTPGYAARDVQGFDSFLDAERTGSGNGTARIEDAKTQWGGSMDGNNVVLEEQSMIAIENEGQYKLATRLYAKGHQLMAIAAGTK